MRKSESVYRRLTGRKRSPLGFSQLWLGPGHILLLKSNHYSEEYRRFALADIQAFVITNTPGRMMFQWMGLIAAAFWTLGFLAVHSPFAKGFFGISGAVALAVIIVDIARGPRCRCHLYTAVSREILPPVSRLRQAQMFLAQVNPEIEAVQGGRQMGLPDGQANTVVQPEAAVSASEPPPPRVPTRPFYLAEILFVLLLANAVLLLVSLGFPKSIPYDILSAAFFAQIVFALGALTLSPDRERGRLRHSPWMHDSRWIIDVLAVMVIFGTAWDFVSLGRGYFTWVAQMAEAGRQGRPIILEFFWTPSRQEALFAAGWRLAAGLAGLTAALLERHGLRRV